MLCAQERFDRDTKKSPLDMALRVMLLSAQIIRERSRQGEMMIVTTVVALLAVCSAETQIHATGNPHISAQTQVGEGAEQKCSSTLRQGSSCLTDINFATVITTPLPVQQDTHLRTLTVSASPSTARFQKVPKTLCNTVCEAHYCFVSTGEASRDPAPDLPLQAAC